jgi:hypothetical protein
VVAETEKDKVGKRFNKNWAMEVFPAPEGAVKIITF